MEARRGKAWSLSAFNLAAFDLSNQVSSSESRSTLVPEAKSSIDKRTLDMLVPDSFVLASGSLIAQFRFRIREHFRYKKIWAMSDALPYSAGDQISVSTEGNDRFPKVRGNCILDAALAAMMRHENRGHLAKVRAVSDHDQTVVSVRYNSATGHVYTDVSHLVCREQRSLQFHVLKIVLRGEPR